MKRENLLKQLNKLFKYKNKIILLTSETKKLIC